MAIIALCCAWVSSTQLAEMAHPQPIPSWVGPITESERERTRERGRGREVSRRGRKDDSYIMGIGHIVESFALSVTVNRNENGEDVFAS